MKAENCDVLGLFPAIGPGRIGGVQVSGLTAWQGLRDLAGLDRGQYRLFCYEPSAGASDSFERGAFVAFSKVQAIRVAFAGRWHPRLTLVWHVAMLRLLPFFRVGRGPVVLFLHGIEAWRRHDALTRSLFKRVTLFLTNSAYTWQRFTRYYPSLQEAHHQVVHLGVGVPEPSVIARPAEPPAVLMLGRLLRSEDYKGHRELIGAWPLVAQRVPGAELWIAGDGDLRPPLQQLIDQHKLTGLVHLLGSVSEPRKQELLLRSRALAMPSRGEGFGLVYLEAMRLGRPCLVSDCDAGREVVNPSEAGLAVSPADPGALANAICRLLAPGPEWERMSLAARRRYDDNFTATHFQHRLLDAVYTR